MNDPWYFEQVPLTSAVCKVIAAELAIPETRLKDKTSLAKQCELTQDKFLGLVICVEKEFHTHIPKEQARYLDTVDDFVDCVRENRFSDRHHHPFDAALIRYLSRARLYNVDVALKQAPMEPGIYGWYLKTLPGCVLTQGCVRTSYHTLLYVGLSKKSIRARLRLHARGNECGSSLRLHLGCLLREDLELRLRRVGIIRRWRRTFGADGEQRLSAWIAENAAAAWMPNGRAEELERRAIAKYPLPLNIRHNENHPFAPKLSALVKQCKKGR